MTKENEVKAHVQATGALLKMIEEAGRLQAEFNDAKVAYEKIRQKLKSNIDDDVAVYGENYWVINSHDEYNEIDPNDFIEKIKDKKLRRKMLKVQLGVTRQELSVELQEELLESKTSKTTTLHVHKIKDEEEE